MANVLVSYEGRERLTVDLSNVDPGKRIISGDTLYMRPSSTKVVTEEEYAEIKKCCPADQLRFLRKHEDKSKKGKALRKVQEVKLISVPKPAEKTAEGVKKRAERLAKAKAKVKGPSRVVVDGPPNPVSAPVTVAKATGEGKVRVKAEDSKDSSKEATEKGPPKKTKKGASFASSG